MQKFLESDDLNVTVTIEQEVFRTLAKWVKWQAEPLGEEQQLALFALVCFLVLSQDFIDSAGLAEPACSIFFSQRLFSTQFKNIFFGGEKPKPHRTTYVDPKTHVHLHICIYICIYINLYSYTYTYTYTYIFTYIYTCV